MPEDDVLKQAIHEYESEVEESVRGSIQRFLEESE
jgi:hypothetical protein